MANFIILCRFSGAAAELPRGRRTADDVLDALRRDPRVSTFDLCESRWLDRAISDLKLSGRITEDKSEPYPWHRFTVVGAAREQGNG